jgi:hypothetical protein
MKHFYRKEYQTGEKMMIKRADQNLSVVVVVIFFEVLGERAPPLRMCQNIFTRDNFSLKN